MPLPPIRPQSRKHMKRIFGHSLVTTFLNRQPQNQGNHSRQKYANKSAGCNNIVSGYRARRKHETVFPFRVKDVCCCSAGKPLLWSPYIPRPLHKRKGGQVRFSNDQTIELEKMFETQKYLSPPERKRLAKVLQLSERQVRPKIKYYLIRSPI